MMKTEIRLARPHSSGDIDEIVERWSDITGLELEAHDDDGALLLTQKEEAEADTAYGAGLDFWQRQVASATQRMAETETEYDLVVTTEDYELSKLKLEQLKRRKFFGLI